MPSNAPQSSVLLHRINPNPNRPWPPPRPPPRATTTRSAAALYHTYAVGPDQCCSAVVQRIDAPLPTVWSFVRRFDHPQAYKHFVKSCHVLAGDRDVGALREIRVVSGLPAANSTERLEILDDERHVISFSVVGGDHRLANYRSVTTLHPSADGDGHGDGEGTVVVESYVVDVPPGNTKEETCVFVDTIVRCNLQSLSQISRNLARNINDGNNNNSGKPFSP
ncbi:hypothetical protein EUGRSUZ_A00613 [Eucalyptus grandis]|uniref:Uncharacterized protein n=2 Tax=Eucalyptus grandis TaxID=71139 RepID=A0ACC3M133_EUCGR|nr:hypothetical protein EUGRSUZ_A00613 [Eucalyptus grandis]